MAENEEYVAVSRIKVGRGPNDYIEVGESVTQDDLEPVEGDLDELVKAGSVVTEERFDELFPNWDEEQEEGANQATGTPSNLAPTGGTSLEAGDEGVGDADKAVKDGDAKEASKDSDADKK